MLTALLFAAYAATLPVANWMIGNVGDCHPGGPCVIPVGLGLYAPSGVLVIGLAFVLRDLVQRRAGAAAGLGCIAVGAGIAWWIAPPALALASVVSATLAELVDFGIYTPLQKRGFVRAVALSSAAAAVVDSALFLWLAFGALDFMAGQVLGKWLAVGAATIVVAALRGPR